MQDFSDDRRFGDDLLLEKPKKRNRSFFIPFVLIGGLATTLAVLVALFVLSMVFHTNILSFIYGFIPLGAILAGLVAGSGYALTARLLQFRPSSAFILFICLLQFGMFFAGRYLEYVPAKLLLDDMPGFAEYYRAQIEDSEWTSKGSDKPYTMGKWGWLLELFSAGCFSLTSLVWVGVLSAAAYCSECRLFMKKELEFAFPARIPPEKIKKKDTEALEDFQRRDGEALEKALDRVARIVAFLHSERKTDRDELYRFLYRMREELAIDPKLLNKVSNRIRVTFSACRECTNYHLTVNMEQVNPNDKSALKTAELLRFVDGSFVGAVPELSAPGEEKSDSPADGQSS